MKEKLTLQDIVDLLAKKTSLNKKEADNFFREFFAVIVENVFDNEPVKIKDFGTFKLTKVNSRESINVNTGEKIEIPAHYKLSFLPDKSLKELVNKPFAHFETTLLEDGVSFDSVQETEEVSVSEEEDTGVDESVTDNQEVVEASTSSSTVSENTAIQPDEKEIEPENLSSKKTSGEKPSVKEEKPQATIYTSSVYTYVLNYDIAEQGSVSISMPADFFGKQPEKSDHATEKIEPQQTEDITPKDILPEEKEDISHDTQQEEESGKTPPIEVNKVQEKIDQLKEAIEALTRKEPIDTTEELPLEIEVPVSYLSDNSSSETDEKEEVTPEIPLSDESIEKEEKKQIEEEDTNIYIPAQQENEIPSIDLDQLESVVLNDSVNVSYSAFKDVNDDHISSILEEKEGVRESPDEIESDNDFMEDFHYTDFYKETAFSRFRRKLPIILVLLLLIGFGIYQFYNLFNVQQGFPSYNGYRNYVITDSVATDSSDVLENDSTNVVNENIGMNTEEDITPIPPPVNDEQVTVLPPDELSSGIEETPETSAPTTSNKYDKVISDNLKIKVVEKAAYIQGRGQDGEDGTSTTANTGRNYAKMATEVVQKGSTFRTIATKYYGRSDFWVYIYEENKNIVPDYNTLPVGVELIIPSLEKYGTGINDPRATEKAKETELSVYNTRRSRY